MLQMCKAFFFSILSDSLDPFVFKAFFSVSFPIPWTRSHLRLFFSILSDSLDPFVPYVSKLSSLPTFSR